MMGKRSTTPELAEADSLSRPEVEAEIDRLRLRFSFVARGGAAYHQFGSAHCPMGGCAQEPVWRRASTKSEPEW